MTKRHFGIGRLVASALGLLIAGCSDRTPVEVQTPVGRATPASSARDTVVYRVTNDERGNAASSSHIVKVPVVARISERGLVSRYSTLLRPAALGQTQGIAEFRRLAGLDASIALAHTIEAAPLTESLCSNVKPWRQVIQAPGASGVSMELRGLGDEPASDVRVFVNGRQIARTTTAWLRLTDRWEATSVIQYGGSGNVAVRTEQSSQRQIGAPRMRVFRVACQEENANAQVSSTSQSQNFTGEIGHRASPRYPYSGAALGAPALDIGESCASTAGPCITEFMNWTAFVSAAATAAAGVYLACVTPVVVVPFVCAAAWVAYTAASAAAAAAWRLFRDCKEAHGIACGPCPTGGPGPAVRVGLTNAIGSLRTAILDAASVSLSTAIGPLGSTTSLDIYGEDCGDPSKSPTGGSGYGGGSSNPVYFCQQWFWYEAGVAVAEWWECECISNCPAS
jgi:hypothetical protein